MQEHAKEHMRWRHQYTYRLHVYAISLCIIVAPFLYDELVFG